MNLVLENVQPSHLPVFRELAKSLHIKMRKEEVEKKAKSKLTAEQQEFVDDLKEALHEVELHQQGKIKLQSARDFLAELRREKA
jgi:RNA polymerase-interacting CarD/CdnL/TRCF family regulator